jgi:catecholate siderophore receptor
MPNRKPVPTKQSKKTKQSGNSWPVTYRWLATGTLAVYTAVGCHKLTAAPLPFQQGEPTRRGEPTGLAFPGAVLPPRRFDIPAGLLQEAAQLFRQATNLEISMVNEGIGQLATPGVSGVLTPEQALDQLLKNTGVHWRFTGPAAVLLELNSVTASVDVGASASVLPTSMAKYSEPIRDTPQTVNVVSQQVMKEQNVTTLRDALRNVAGISIAAGEGGAQGDNLTIRGFSARNDLYIDGMRDFGSYYRDPFNLEEVDVVQGPASATFGRGSTGGVVNQATKMPTLQQSFSGGFDGGTDGTRRATMDVNLPLTSLGKGDSFRLNAMGTEGGVAGRDVAYNRRYGLAPTLSLGMGTPTRVTLSHLNQQADDTPDYGIPWLFNQPAPVDRHNYYGFRDANHLQTKDNIATVRAEHDLNSHISIRNQTRYARYLRDVLITEPQILGTVSLATPLSDIAINRNQLASNSVEAFLANQTDVTMNFQTGSVRHTAVVGVELDREDSDPTRPRYTGVPATTLLAPDTNQAFAGIPAINTIVHTRSNSVAAYVTDTAKFGSHWELNGSFRFDRFNSHYTQAVAPAAAFNRLDLLPSWRGALVYKPVQPVSIYASAGNSFNPSAESLSLSASTANLPPEENRTYEVGMKWDVPRSGLSLRTAVFRTDKVNAREPDPDNSLLNVLAGKQRVEGFEAELNGHLTRHWDAQASYAYLDATLRSSNFYPAAVGARLANVPRHTFTVWQTYRLPWKTRIGAGGNFVGSRTASSTVPFDPITGLVKQAPGYWVFNAMVERPITEHATLHANVYNLADRYYYDQLHPAHIVLGPARSALIGIRFRF